MNNISYFQLTRLDRKTLDCISTLDYESCTSKSEVEKKYNELMGYNPSSSLGNKQQCKQCGKFGYSCLGHPVKIDIKQDYLLPYAEKAINALMKVFCYDCGHSVEQMDKKRPVSLFTYASNVKQQMYHRHSRGECNVFVFAKMANLTLFLSKLNEDDLLSFGLSKRAIMDTVIHELVLLPLCLQPSDPRTTKVAHTKHHLELISVLRTQSKDQNAKVKAIIDKLMIAKSDERTSHIQMCEGKEGVFRGTAIGKRTWNTARAVLVPGGAGIDDKSAMGVLMIPRIVADTLKYEYVVSVHNIDQLSKTASHVINANGKYIKMSSFTRLKIGDKVLRSLTGGDYVIFNRCPTLDNVSEVGYQIQVWDGNCFKLHELNTIPHNADFDGDAGGVHVGNNSASRIEMEATSVKYRIMRTKSGEASTGITYNGIIGCYLLCTDDNLELNGIFDNLLKIIGLNELNGFKSIQEQLDYYQDEMKKHGIPFKSGRTIMSMLLPKSLRYKGKEALIVNGILISGRLSKSDVADKLVNAIFNIDKWEFPYLFINKGYEVCSYYASVRGITLGIREYCHCLTFDKERLSLVDNEIKRLENRKDTLTDSGKIKTENEILTIIGDLCGSICEPVKSLLEGNQVSQSDTYAHLGDLGNISYKSGARGSIENVASAIASIGQLYRGNNRLTIKSNTSRHSPYAEIGSKSIFDNGFIMSSYASGLTGAEVMQMAVPARESAIVVYRVTPECGAMSRQLCLQLGGVVINDRFQVIGRNGEIMSFLYGTGSDTIYTGRKSNPLGEMESPVDWIQILETL